MLNNAGLSVGLVGASYQVPAGELGLEAPLWVHPATVSQSSAQCCIPELHNVVSEYQAGLNRTPCKNGKTHISFFPIEKPECWDWRWRSEAEHLPSVHRSLVSVPSSTNKWRFQVSFDSFPIRLYFVLAQGWARIVTLSPHSLGQRLDYSGTWKIWVRGMNLTKRLLGNQPGK